MDPWLSEMSKAVNGFGFDDGNNFVPTCHSQNHSNGIKDGYLELGDLEFPSPPLSPNMDNMVPSSNVSYDIESPNDHDSDPVLKFLNQILVEENMEEKPCMFHDPLALRATEKSLYEVIGKEYPLSPYRLENYGEDSPDSFFGNSSEQTNSSNAESSSLIDPQWFVDSSEYNYVCSVEQGHLKDHSSNSFSQASSQPLLGTANSIYDNASAQMSSFGNPSTVMLSNMFRDNESILQFKRGMEEASKFLPPSNPLTIDLDKYELPKKSEDVSSNVAIRVEKKDSTGDSPNGSGLRGRKHHHPDDGDPHDIERSSKQSAIHEEDVELSEMFDRVLLCRGIKEEPQLSSMEMPPPPQSVTPPNGSNTRGARAKKNESKEDNVDLVTLLISCAQSVASDDRRTAYEQLKQIREHSSRTGNAYQRLAHVFASGLHARLGGTGTELYASLTRKRITAAEKLKAFHVYLLACPFKKLSIFFANMMIGMVASEATTLHIIDFGILYGFQWPVLIQDLSERVGGPPKLRVTGIELPQSGFRPAERVEETGRRLAKYCERFGVPFEYQPIATQNWEMIKLKDLKIAKGEVLAVNSLFQFGRLLDETVVVDSPRDAILNLIRKMKPDIFVTAVGNGSYSSPFFVMRFREALFHYSAQFDMFDATLPRDNPQRMNFEQDFYGREVINVIACEGAERVERPETYKQWQVRYFRDGFRPLPLNPEIMKKLRYKATALYHKDFLFDEDGNWMLQGWKGRIICASSCWVPS